MSARTVNFAAFSNGGCVPLGEIPELDVAGFGTAIVSAVNDGMRVSSLFGAETKKPGETMLYAILSDDADSRLLAARTLVRGDSFPSLTPDCPQVHLFEREIAEQFGLTPAGHPWMKPVRYSRSRTDRDAWNRSRSEPIQPGSGDFFRVSGRQVHEVAVGPVHAGIIEPGHFRFQCQGERVLNLEIALGYQHRGIEVSMEGGPSLRSLHLMETVAGDTTIGHSLTYCQILESLSGRKPPARAQVLRGLALELERLANHTGDLGALSGDVGYLPTASFCGRIRGDFLNLTALLCGNRFGRGFVRPGGTGFDLAPADVPILVRRMEILKSEAETAIGLLWENQSVMARFEETGVLPRETAAEFGIVGPAARASGLRQDVRFSHPSGLYRFAQMPLAASESGDVFARAFVRWMEIRHSADFIIEQAGSLPGGPVRTAPDRLAGNSLSAALNEGWRGEICHTAITGGNGNFIRYKITDPSFHNWLAVSRVMHNQEISDFPLCNKSFNLSYCGHDL